jgi:hypothetical protein
MKKLGVKKLESLAPEKYPEVCLNCPLPRCILDYDGRGKNKENISKQHTMIAMIYYMRVNQGMDLKDIAVSLNIPKSTTQFYWAKRNVLSEQNINRVG